MGSDRSFSTTGDNSLGDLLSTNDRVSTDSIDREARNRRVVSAIVELADEEDEVEDSEKETEELSLPPYSSHCSSSKSLPKPKFQFVFPKRKVIGAAE